MHPSRSVRRRGIAASGVFGGAAMVMALLAPPLITAMPTAGNATSAQPDAVTATTIRTRRRAYTRDERCKHDAWPIVTGRGRGCR